MTGHWKVEVGPLSALALLLLFNAGTIASQGPDPTGGKADFAGKVMTAIQVIGQAHVVVAAEADMARWAIYGLYEASKEPIPASLANRLKGLRGAEQAQMASLLHDARTHLGKRTELENDKDFEACVQAIFAGLEPGLRPRDRSCYFPPDKIVRLNVGGPVANRVGIGLELEKDPTTDMLRVRTPILHGPAYKTGLRAGDLITHIGVDTNQDGALLPKPKIVPTKGLSVERAQDLFFGITGTRVILKVVPAGRPGGKVW